MKLGILGGTFNPPHIGHLILARDIMEKAGLDRILFVPTNVPPHKDTAEVSAHHRYAMVELAVAGHERFDVLDIELKREGPSYTVDTVRALKKMFPADSLYLVIGSDLAADFESWRSPEEIRKSVTIIVARRSEFPCEEKEGFTMIDVPHVEISSSLVRDLKKNKKSIQYLVPPAVAGYIEKHKLYL